MGYSDWALTDILDNSNVQMILPTPTQLSTCMSGYALGFLLLMLFQEWVQGERRSSFWQVVGEGEARGEA